MSLSGGVRMTTLSLLIILHLRLDGYGWKSRGENDVHLDSL